MPYFTISTVQPVQTQLLHLNGGSGDHDSQHKATRSTKMWRLRPYICSYIDEFANIKAANAIARDSGFDGPT